MSKDRLSSDNLYHFKSNTDVLKSILTDGFSHRMWDESIPYKKSIQQNFMVCFCDIRIEDAGYHRQCYGDNAIVLSKEWGINNGVNPVRYVTASSPGVSQDYLGMKNRFREIRRVAEDHHDSVVMNYSILSVLKDDKKLSYDSIREEFVLKSSMNTDYDNLETEFLGIFEQLKGTPGSAVLSKFLRSIGNRFIELHNELEKRDALMRAYAEDFTHPTTKVTIVNKVLYDEREWRSIKFAAKEDYPEAVMNKFLPVKYNLIFKDTDVIAILLKDQNTLDDIKNYLSTNKTLLSYSDAESKLALIGSYTEKLK